MKRMLILAISAIALLAVGYLARDWLREDKCFDKGGAWDAATSTCRADGKELDV
jgi:hypothetical protein